MIPILIAFACFAYWWLIGLGALTALRLDTRDARVALSAPAVGSSVLVLPLFVCSYGGVAMHDTAAPIVAGLASLAAVSLVWRRPPVSPVVIPVVLICIAATGLLVTPFFSFGFHWFANANDDMANYVLSATHLVGHGLLGPIDLTGLAHDRGYTSTLQQLHNAGSRPGADITLAALASVTGRPAADLFMTFIFALQLVCICAAASLTLTSTRRRWAAVLAAGLLVISPLAAYGMLQQLLPQVWGLGLAATLFAYLLRPEIHRRDARWGDVAAIGIVAAAVIVVYVELASTLVLVYALFVLVLLLRREVAGRALLRLWGPALAIIVILLNAYLLKEVSYVHNQANSGFASSGGSAGPDIFGYAVVPSALAGLFGLEAFRPLSPHTPHLALFIGLSIAALAVVGGGSVVAAVRGYGTGVVIVAYAIVGFALALNGADFGEFKLFMYAQPFLAAAVASWFGRTRPLLSCLAAVPLVALVAVQVGHEHNYVKRSRDPIDLHHASDSELMPAFRRFYATANGPVVSVTDNPVLAKLEASLAGDGPLYLISSNIFGSLLSGAAKVTTGHFSTQAHVAAVTHWTLRSFDLLDGRYDEFDENGRASRLIRAGDCSLILPTGSQLALNRLRFPEGSRDIVNRRCGAVHDILVFQNSARGLGFYSAYRHRRDVSFYQLEKDDGFGGTTTFSGVGRYLLFRILGPSRSMRVVLTLSETPLPQRALPPAHVIGTTRVRFGFVGSGSGRLVSAPVRPQLIGGVPYLLLDLGRDGSLRHEARSGILGLYGKHVTLDPRYLTSYLRDISLVDSSADRDFTRTTAISSFPRDLRRPRLLYSGIFEDGWVAAESSVTLAGGRMRSLVIRATTLPIPGQRLTVRVDRRVVSSGRVSGTSVSVSLPVAASPAERVVTLQWQRTRAIGAGDARRVAAHLSYIGLRR